MSTTPPRCAQPEILAALATWVAAELPVLGDLGYEGESETTTVGVKKPRGGTLSIVCLHSADGHPFY